MQFSICEKNKYICTNLKYKVSKGKPWTKICKRESFYVENIMFIEFYNFPNIFIYLKIEKLN